VKLYAIILVSGSGKTYNANLYHNVIELEQVCGFCSKCEKLTKAGKWDELARLRAKHFNDEVFPKGLEKMLVLLHSHQEAKAIGALVLGYYKVEYGDFIKIKRNDKTVWREHHWHNAKTAEIKTHKEIASIIKRVVYKLL